MGRGGVGVVGGEGDCSQNQSHMLKLAAMPANAQNLLKNTSWMAKLSHILNQRTNGPVNAHLRSAAYTNKHV